MKDIQAHLDKIRSDAAECALLSNLATDGKGEVFAKTAEHLRTLAAEVEKTIAANSVKDLPREPAPVQEEPKPAVASVAPRQRGGSWAGLAALWCLTALLGGIIGVLVWTNGAARSWISVLPSQAETTSATSDDTKRIVALLTGDQNERKAVLEQVNALSARVDNLGRVVGTLQAARAPTIGPEPPRTEDKTPAADVPAPIPGSVATAPVTDTPSASNTSGGETTGANSPAAEPVDRTGAIQAPVRRTDLNSRRLLLGPPGCTQFRSFDAASGTYRTLGGRRRPCRS